MRKSASPALDVRKQLQKNGRMYTVYSLEALRDYGYEHIEILPYSIRILLENLLRNAGTEMVRRQDIDKLASWHPDMTDPSSIAFMPGRVVLQDFTGVPALVDLAALRSAVARSGGNPAALNPFVPADLIIDHSVQVDFFGTQDALARNVEREMERNRERYSLLRWGQQAFTRFQVVPPGTGIVHQVNLEYLASVVQKNTGDDETILYPDTVLGTDSHTTMINGLGVLGWGVGGIEAEAVLLGQPYFMQIPEVVGVRLTGRLREGVTATDLVLTITQYLRAKGVVGRFVEFFGTGAGKLALPDRATIANMAPEYGATMGYFPVDEQTLAYLLASGRDKKQVELVEWYMNEQGLFRTASSPEPVYSVVYTIDLGQVEPSLAGPEKPQKRIALSAMASTFSRQLPPAAAPSMEGENNGGCWADEGGACDLTIPDCGCPEVSEDGHRLGCFEVGGQQMLLSNGAVVIAAITSCTNTSNPAVMIGAGLLARQAVKLGLQVKPWVKTSLAPGSRVVSRYLEDAGLLDPLQSLGFYIVGYGCTTCIGNSGPLDLEIARIIKQKKLLAAAVLSGNRNFQARIHPLVRANYLCSPLLVVAYALAGSMMIDLVHDPLGLDADGYPVYFKDILPTDEEIETVVKETVTPQLFSSSYSGVFSGNESWNGLQVPAGKLFSWDTDSSYIREPPFFKDLPATPRPVSDINDAAILAIFGDTVTTDHISPAGAIPVDSPAGKYLQKQGVARMALTLAF